MMNCWYGCRRKPFWPNWGLAHHPGTEQGNGDLGTFNIPADIRTPHLSNTDQKPYSLIQIFCSEL
jgi:hypothetical protein